MKLQGNSARNRFMVWESLKSIPLDGARSKVILLLQIIGWFVSDFVSGTPGYLPSVSVACEYAESLGENGALMPCWDQLPSVQCPARHSFDGVQDYRRGQELVKNRDFKANETFFKDVFEVGRRYKIMNPDRMRGTYGKLLYMLMDTADQNIEELLEFSCIKCDYPTALPAWRRFAVACDSSMRRCHCG